MQQANILEQNHDNRAPKSFVQGIDFLRKSIFCGFGLGYTYRDFAIALSERALFIGSECGDGMETPEKIVRFLQHNAGVSFCDRCLQKECFLRRPSQAAGITTTLQLFPEFRRMKGRCAKCARSRRLTTCAV